MRGIRSAVLISAVLAVAGICLGDAAAEAAPQLTVLHPFEAQLPVTPPRFSGLYQPYVVSDPVVDGQGAVYGTVSINGPLKKCGVQRCGYVYKMTPPAAAGGD